MAHALRAGPETVYASADAAWIRGRFWAATAKPNRTGCTRSCTGLTPLSPLLSCTGRGAIPSQAGQSDHLGTQRHPLSFHGGRRAWPCRSVKTSIPVGIALSPTDKETAKTYALLRDAMAKSNKAAIATFVMRGKEDLAAIRADSELLVLETMYFADEIRDPKKEDPTSPEQFPDTASNSRWPSNSSSP